MGTPNRKPQEFIQNITEYKDPGRYIPNIFLLQYWGSLFGVPMSTLLFYEGLGLGFLLGPVALDFWTSEGLRR